MAPNMLGVMSKFNKRETEHLLRVLQARGVLSEQATTKEIFLLRRSDVIRAIRYYSGANYPESWALDYYYRIRGKSFKRTPLRRRITWLARWLKLKAINS